VKLILFEKSRVNLEFHIEIRFFNLYDKSPETLWELRSIRASPLVVPSVSLSTHTLETPDSGSLSL
jgi:hypothetical protein